jgi:hypothetical protein
MLLLFHACSKWSGHVDAPSGERQLNGEGQIRHYDSGVRRRYGPFVDNVLTEPLIIMIPIYIECSKRGDSNY